MSPLRYYIIFIIHVFRINSLQYIDFVEGCVLLFLVTCLLVRFFFVDVLTTIANSVFFFLPWNPYGCLESSSQRLGSFSLLLSVLVVFAESETSRFTKMAHLPGIESFCFVECLFPWDAIDIVLYKFYNTFYKMATTKKKQPQKLRNKLLKMFLLEKNTIFTG